MRSKSEIEKACNDIEKTWKEIRDGDPEECQLIAVQLHQAYLVLEWVLEHRDTF